MSGPLQANSGDLTIAAAIAGMGVVFEPDYVMQPAFDAGLLVRVRPGYDNFLLLSPQPRSQVSKRRSAMSRRSLIPVRDSRITTL